MTTETQETIIARCDRCRGTGLYRGMAEMPGAAVVCRECKGTGSREITYVPFDGRQPPPEGVERVWSHNRSTPPAEPGDQPGAGVTVEEWQVDPESVHRPGAEERENSCPSLWHAGLIWDECIKAGTIPGCPRYPERAACWEKYDRLNGEAETEETPA